MPGDRSRTPSTDNSNRQSQTEAQETRNPSHRQSTNSDMLHRQLHGLSTNTDMARQRTRQGEESRDNSSLVASSTTANENNSGSRENIPQDVIINQQQRMAEPQGMATREHQQELSPEALLQASLIDLQNLARVGERVQELLQTMQTNGENLMWLMQRQIDHVQQSQQPQIQEQEHGPESQRLIQEMRPSLEESTQILNGRRVRQRYQPLQEDLRSIQGASEQQNIQGSSETPNQRGKLPLRERARVEELLRTPAWNSQQVQDAPHSIEKKEPETET